MFINEHYQLIYIIQNWLKLIHIPTIFVNKYILIFKNIGIKVSGYYILLRY